MKFSSQLSAVSSQQKHELFDLSPPSGMMARAKTVYSYEPADTND